MAVAKGGSRGLARQQAQESTLSLGPLDALHVGRGCGAPRATVLHAPRMQHAAAASRPVQPPYMTTCPPLPQLRTVLAAAVDKLSLVGALDSGGAAAAAALARSVGDGIGRVIVEQRALEARFEELAAAQRELRRQPNKARLQENEVRPHRTPVADALAECVAGRAATWHPLGGAACRALWQTRTTRPPRRCPAPDPPTS